MNVAKLVIQNERDEFAMQKRAPDQEDAGLWDFFGGRLEVSDNGNPKRAALREGLEELTYDFGDIIEIGGLICEQGRNRTYFHAKISSSTQLLLGEGADIGWFTFDQVMTLPLRRHVVLFFERFKPPFTRAVSAECYTPHYTAQ